MNRLNKYRVAVVVLCLLLLTGGALHDRLRLEELKLALVIFFSSLQRLNIAPEISPLIHFPTATPFNSNVEYEMAPFKKPPPQIPVA